MDLLSQNELIGVVALIRDKKEYQECIFEYNLLNELHMIVHHEQSSKNKYHGQWSDELKNKVIHQILYRIIPTRERDTFTKDHPLLLKINELTEDNERGSEISGYFIGTMQGWTGEIASLKEHIKKIETTEISDFIETIKEHECIIRHYNECFVKPLLKLGWIDESQIIPKGLIRHPDLPESYRIYLRDHITTSFNLDMDIPPVVYFRNLCADYRKEFLMNEKYKQKITGLMTEISSLKKENDNLRKENVTKLKALFD